MAVHTSARIHHFPDHRSATLRRTGPKWEPFSKPIHFALAASVTILGAFFVLMTEVDGSIFYRLVWCFLLVLGVGGAITLQTLISHVEKIDRP